MRNLKKVLALVVAVAMIASMGLVASAASYSDVASNASYADAVNLLSNLGIIKGYEDGTFKPDNTVTRAEAAAMMVRMLALDDEVEMGATNFTDVAADNWASGYVNVAEANGIINGMGDGTFNPNGEVTYGQIVKMIVCALGYEPVALANGGYLGGGYLYAASKHCGFTKGVAGTANGAASRATVARLIYNALEVELMDQTSFSTGINGSTFTVQKDKTILSEYLGLEKVDAVVMNTYLSDASYEADEAVNEVELVITKIYVDDKYVDPAYDVADKDWFVAEGTDAATLLGYTVTAYVGENEDGDDAIFAIAEKAGKNTMTTVDSELIKTFDLKNGVVEYYKSETSKSTTDAELQDYVEYKGSKIAATDNVVVNGFNNSDYAAKFDVKKVSEVQLLDNDNDGDFEFIFANMPVASTEFVVEEIETDDELWVFTGENGDYSVDLDDEKTVYTIMKDGKIVDVDAIVEGDVITVLDTKVNIQNVLVSSVVVESIVDEVDEKKVAANNEYYIDGKAYKLSALSTVKAPEAGDEGLFYINVMGKIAYIDAVSTLAGADYVYVVDAYAADTTKWDDESKVKAITVDGELETIVIKEKKVSMYEGSKLTTETATGVDVAKALLNKVSKSAGVLVKIDTNASGEITDIYFVGTNEFVENKKYANDLNAKTPKSYNENRGTYGVVDLLPETVVFEVAYKNGEDLEDCVTVSTVADTFVDDASYNFTAYYADVDEAAEVLVVTDSNTAADAEAPVMVVTNVRKVTSEDEKTWKITGIMAGEEVTVIVDPEVATTAAPAKVGQVIIFSETESYVEDINVLFDTETKAVKGTDDIKTVLDEETVTVHAGEVDEKESRFFTLKNLVDPEDTSVLLPLYFDDEVNVTVVDYTGREVEIEEGSLTDVKPVLVAKGEKAETKKTVFIKTVSDEIDVVNDIVVVIENN